MRGMNNSLVRVLAIFFYQSACSGLEEKTLIKKNLERNGHLRFLRGGLNQ